MLLLAGWWSIAFIQRDRGTLLWLLLELDVFLSVVRYDFQMGLALLDGWLAASKFVLVLVVNVFFLLGASIIAPPTGGTEWHW